MCRHWYTLYQIDQIDTFFPFLTMVISPLNKVSLKCISCHLVSVSLCNIWQYYVLFLWSVDPCNSLQCDTDPFQELGCLKFIKYFLLCVVVTSNSAEQDLCWDQSLRSVTSHLFYPDKILVLVWTIVAPQATPGDTLKILTFHHRKLFSIA